MCGCISRKEEEVSGKIVGVNCCGSCKVMSIPYTNVADSFPPAILPKISSYGHYTVVAYSRISPAALSREYVRIKFRSNDSTDKHLFAHALGNFDWRPLELMGNIDT